MLKTEKTPSDFELLTLLVHRLEIFSYKDVQDKVRQIQEQYKLFKIYFNNCGDAEGGAFPESLQLSFHFKVLYKLGYIQSNERKYVTSEKCKQEAKRIRHGWATSRVAEKIFSRLFSP